MIFKVAINSITVGHDNFVGGEWSTDETPQINKRIEQVNATDREDALNSVLDYVEETLKRRLAVNESLTRNDSSITLFNNFEHHGQIEFTIYSVAVFSREEVEPL